SVKNLRLRSAANIQVDTLPTEPSTPGLSLLSSIDDKTDYLQNRIIFKNRNLPTNSIRFNTKIEDNN
ncbi:hypothetical protein JW979_05660, partial [bacterium]|nr:hypothetical protein [candidate division CSSED10-310 bacterium]